MPRQPTARSGSDGRLSVQIETMPASERRAAVDLLAEGMRDNPLHVRVFGADPARRQQRLQRLLQMLVGHVQSRGTLLGAYADGDLIGVLGMLPPGRCRPGWFDTVRLAGTIALSNPPATAVRARQWLMAWERNDPTDPHWHLGPMAVRTTHRRQGVARCLMETCCKKIDAQGAIAWLETDLQINVSFYETLGFSITCQEEVLGVTNWFMTRPAAEK